MPDAPERRNVTTRPALTPVEVAWLATVPCAIAVTLVAIVLGPPMGRIAFPANDVTFWPGARQFLAPEPTEQARYLIALSLPILLSAIVMWAPRNVLGFQARAAARLVPPLQTAWLLGLVGCLIVQERHWYDQRYGQPVPFRFGYFNGVELVTSAVLAAGLLFIAADERRRSRVAVLLARNTRRVAVATTMLAVLITTIWLLPAVNSESSVIYANPGIAFHLQFTYDETYVLFNHQFPLVNFPTQYGALWPYFAALLMLVTGKSVLAFTIIMCALSGITLLAVLGILRQLTQSSIGALLLYLPFLAISSLVMVGPMSDRFSYMTYFGMFPLRTAGPYLLALLTLRYLRTARQGAFAYWPLFLVAGLVPLNNVDFGIPASAGTIAALIWTSRGPRAPPVATLLRSAAVGLTAAVAVVSALTLTLAGSLPHFGLLFEYARLFAVDGYNLMPMPLIGFHLVVYATFVAAIVLATVRAVNYEPDRALTGMLAWVGIFGLGSASYYVGRSHPHVLIASFSPWALTIALFAIVVSRNLAGRTSRRPTAPAVAVALGLALSASWLIHPPLPWAEVDSIAHPRPTSVSKPTLFAEVDGFVDFVRATARPGEKVAIVVALGHVIADRAGVVNVAPYTGFNSMPTEEQLTKIIQVLRKAGGSRIYMFNGSAWPETADALIEQGFVRAEETAEKTEFRDTSK